MKIIVTFGYDHNHELEGGRKLNNRVVAEIECTGEMDGRAQAFHLFGPKWCMAYTEAEFAKTSMAQYRRIKIGEQPKIGISSIVYLAGQTEDGEDYMAEEYIVVRQQPDGSRQQHVRSFRGCVAHDDHLEDVREQAEADAQTLIDEIGTIGSDDADWLEMPARYGSPAHDEMELMEWEARHD